jgi:hypothetical protein
MTVLDDFLVDPKLSLLDKTDIQAQALGCEADFDIAAAGSGAVGLTRNQTIMQGAPSCTFRYKFTPR